MAKAVFHKKKEEEDEEDEKKKKMTLFTNSKISLNLRNTEFAVQFCMVLKLGHFRKYIRNTLKVLKYGAGKGWRRLVGPNV
jgi:hypothetical protein